jgi:hypothetical protein
VVSFHGGPEGQAVSGFSTRAQLFVDEGFVYVEPNVRGLLRNRIEEQSRTAASGSARGADWATPSARLRRALDPARFERELARIGELDASRIQRAARELLAPERSVIVTASPRTRTVRSASIER